MSILLVSTMSILLVSTIGIGTTRVKQTSTIKIDVRVLRAHREIRHP